MLDEAVNGGTGVYKPILISSFVLMAIGLPGKLISMDVETKRDVNILKAIYEYNGIQIMKHYERNEQEVVSDTLVK